MRRLCAMGSTSRYADAAPPEQLRIRAAACAPSRLCGSAVSKIDMRRARSASCWCRFTSRCACGIAFSITTSVGARCSSVHTQAAGGLKSSLSGTPLTARTSVVYRCCSCSPRVPSNGRSGCRCGGGGGGGGILQRVVIWLLCARLMRRICIELDQRQDQVPLWHGNSLQISLKNATADAGSDLLSGAKSSVRGSAVCEHVCEAHNVSSCTVQCAVATDLALS